MSLEEMNRILTPQEASPASGAFCRRKLLVEAVADKKPSESGSDD